jgi:hypothetical protein
MSRQIRWAGADTVVLVIVTGLVAAGLVWGCVSAGNGPAASYNGSGGGSADSEGCAISADGTCDPNEETCTCADCRNTAYCIVQRDGGADCNPPEQHDDVCHPIVDFCVCGDCMNDPACQDPDQTNCKDDGACDGYSEGCRCADCTMISHCTSQEASRVCTGEMSDGICDADESCGCFDCMWLQRCVPCTTDGQCAPLEGCACPDCMTDPFCTDSKHCDHNGKCDILNEGCACSDCAADPICPQTTGMGGGGGTGGAGMGGGGNP